MSRSALLVIAGLMATLFMASMEGTVVATAMPTIVSQLGGLGSYSWVFSIFLVAATTTVPIFGKLSDLFGPRRVFAVSVSLFLFGSLLCGMAHTMTQLIIFRAIQGLGAGGVLPLAFIIVGALFDYQQRARMQGLFSGVWGLSSIVGPLLGGFIVDHTSWHWIFYINIVPGLVALGLIWFVWVDDPLPAASDVHIDYLGALLLSAAIVVLLLGLVGVGSRAWLLGLAALLFAALVRIELHAADPILPIALFRDRLFAVASAHGIFAGCAMFGSIAFVPLYVQAVLGTSATAAGAILTPLTFAWVPASIISSRLLLRVGYRTLALIGMSLLTLGTLLMTRIDPQTSQLSLIINLVLMGLGMGGSVPSFLIAVQTSVPRHVLGVATSTIQFTRSIGGTLGLTLMGGVLSWRLAALQTAGADPSLGSINRLLAPAVSGPAVVAASVRLALAGAIREIFVIAFVAAALGLIATTMAPRGRIAQLAARRADLERRPAIVAPSRPE